MDVEHLLSSLSEMERLLELPDEPGNLQRAGEIAQAVAAALSIPALAEEARELAGALRALAARRKDGSLRIGRIQDRLWHLRAAIEALRG